MYEYLSAVFAYWWILVSGGVLAVEQAIESFWEDSSRWLDQYISQEKRRRVRLVISFLLIFYAGFLAWRDEHTARIEAEKKIAEISSNKENLLKEAADLWQFPVFSQFEGENILPLSYEPDPKTVTILVNGVSYELGDYGFQLKGRNIVVTNVPTASIQILDLIKKEFPEGKLVKISYMKRLL